jgi:hypothetical protein
MTIKVSKAMLAGCKMKYEAGLDMERAGVGAKRRPITSSRATSSEELLESIRTEIRVQDPAEPRLGERGIPGL